MRALKTKAPLPIQGLNVGAPGEFIDPRQTPYCQNIEMNRSIIRKRPGTAALGASLGERVMAIRELKIGSLSYLLRLGLTKTELLDVVSSTWSSVAGAAWVGTQEDKFSFAFPLIGGSKVMTMSNGVDPITKYTGTGLTAALGGAPPLAKFQLAFSDFLLLANITDGGNDFESRVQWPDVGNPEGWTPGVGSLAGSVDLVEDGLAITGMALFGQYAAVHKENAIYVGYLVGTSAVFKFDRKETGVGAVSNDTIQNLPDGSQIFLARDGLHLFNGITAPLIPSPIMDEIRETMNPTNAYKACSIIVREKDEYWVGVPIGSDTEPTTIYKYNYRTGHAWKDLRTNLTCMATYELTNEVTWDAAVGTWDGQVDRWDDVTALALNPTPVFGDSSGNTSQRVSGASDAGAAIDAYWESKDFTCQDLGIDEDGRMVRWTELQSWLKGSGVSVYYSVDGGSSFALANTLTLTSDYPTDDAPDYSYFDVVSTRIRFRYRNANVNETFTLKNFVLKGVPREARR